MKGAIPQQSCKPSGDRLTIALHFYILVGAITASCVYLYTLNPVVPLTAIFAALSATSILAFTLTWAVVAMNTGSSFIRIRYSLVAVTVSVCMVTLYIAYFVYL